MSKEEKKEQTEDVKKGLVSRAVSSYVGFFKKPIKNAPENIQSIKLTWSGLFKRRQKTRELFLANLNDPDVALMEERFENAMLKWGIQEGEVDGVAEYYKAHFRSGLIAFVLMLVFLLLNLLSQSSIYYALASFIFMVASGFLAVTSYWRYTVLSQRKFVPFMEWLNS
jgi:hypothetical protein